MKLAAALVIVALLAASGSAQGENVMSFYELNAKTLEGTPDSDELENAIEAALEL